MDLGSFGGHFWNQISIIFAIAGVSDLWVNFGSISRTTGEGFCNRFSMALTLDFAAVRSWAISVHPSKTLAGAVKMKVRPEVRSFCRQSPPSEKMRKQPSKNKSKNVRKSVRS